MTCLYANRPGRLCLLTIILWTIVVAVFQTEQSHAQAGAVALRGVDDVPVAGDYWPECKTDQDHYCFEQVTQILPDGTESAYGFGIPYANCHNGTKEPLVCATDGSYWIDLGIGRKFEEADLGTTFRWKLRTGKFSPDVLMLGDTQKTIISGDPTVGWAIEIWAKPTPKAYLSLCASTFACGVDTTAESVTYGVGGYLRTLGVNQSWASVDSVQVKDALRGAFISTNAMAQSWSFEAETFRVAATGPHFLPDGRTLNPGYVRVFLPTAYVLAQQGYSSLDEVAPERVSVTVSDTPVLPSLTVRSDGLMVDTGVTHYSTPNPTIRLLKKSDPVQPVVFVKAGRSISRSLVHSTRQSGLKWTVKGPCVIKGKRIHFVGRAETCTVTVAKTNGPRSSRVVARKLLVAL